MPCFSGQEFQVRSQCDHGKWRLQAWLLIVNLTFPNLKERDKFLPIFAELAKSVAAKERGVLAYELSIADNDPLKIVIFERCVPLPQYSSAASRLWHTQTNA